MSRFIDDAYAELQEGSTASGISTPEIVEKEKPQEKEVKVKTGDDVNGDSAEIVKKQFHNRNHYRKRKSLQEQLINNRNYKYRERKKKMDKQNSSFKMKKETREFYGRLDQERKAKKLQEKETFDKEIEEFRRQRQQQQKKQQKQQQQQQSKQVEQERVDNHHNSSNSNKQDKLKLVEYSDSE